MNVLADLRVSNNMEPHHSKPFRPSLPSTMSGVNGKNGLSRLLVLAGITKVLQRRANCEVQLRLEARSRFQNNQVYTLQATQANLALKFLQYIQGPTFGNLLAFPLARRQPLRVKDRHLILFRVISELHPELSERPVISVPAAPNNLVFRRITQRRELFALKLYLQDNTMIFALMFCFIRLVASEESLIDGANGKSLRESTGFAIRPRVLAIALVQEPSEGLGYGLEIATNRPRAVEITQDKVSIGVEKEFSWTDVAVRHAFVLKSDTGTAQLLHPATSALSGEFCGDMNYLFVLGRRASRLVCVEEHSEASVWCALQEHEVWQLIGASN